MTKKGKRFLEMNVTSLLASVCIRFYDKSTERILQAIEETDFSLEVKNEAIKRIKEVRTND